MDDRTPIEPDDRVVDLSPRLPLDARWRDRLRVSERARRLVPAALAVRGVRRRAARRWDTEPRLQEDARRRMRAVLAGTPRAHEVEALARAAVLEDAAFAELFKRPWVLTDRRRVRGLRHVTDALADGRGVLVSYCHLGPFQGASTAARGSGRRPWVFIGPWMAVPAGVGHDGHMLERWRALTTRSGSRTIITTPGALAVGTELLRRREVVCLLFDMPGGTETPWLGKPVALASGSARMACAAEAVVVPMDSRRAGGSVVSTFHAPLDARDHESPEALHEALAAAHERLVLERPEALENPQRGGAWDHWATPERWSAPPHP